MLKKLIGCAVAVATATVLAPAGTAWAGEPPTPRLAPPHASASVAGTTGELVPGDQAGELVEGAARSLLVAGGHIRIDRGFYYTIPVHYVKLDWTYTWKLKIAIDNHSGTLGILCGYLPSKVAVTTCGALFSLFQNDIRNTVNAAISHRKCYKVRLPITFGGANLAAYDSYYVTC